MADNNELEIVLKLVDEASAKIKSIVGGSQGQINELGNSGRDAGKKISDSFKTARDQINDFKKAIIPVGVIIAGVIKTTQDWSKTNDETKEAYDRIGDVISGLSASIGSLLAPSIIGLSEILEDSAKKLSALFNGAREAYSLLFESISRSVQFYSAFFASLSTGQKVSVALKDALAISEQATVDLTKKFDEAIGKGKEIDIQQLGDETRAASDEAVDAMDEVIVTASRLEEETENFSLLPSTIVNNMKAAVDENQKFLEFYVNEWAIANAGIKSLVVDIGTAIQTNLSAGISDAVLRIRTLSEVFIELRDVLVKTIVDFIAQKIVAFAIEKTLLASGLVASAATALATAEAWAPAASLVSLATFGANAVPATAGILSTTAVARAVAIPQGFQEGTDSVPANLTPGEMVFPKTMAAAIRRGDITVSGPNGGGNIINIYLQGANLSSDQSIEATVEKLGFEIERSLRNSRGI